jgi:YHS domain-containing protein
VLGPVVAALSFVCSVGNIPLAAVLWAGGISFAGVIAFIFADLLIVPIILIYRKYYGGAMTVRIVAIMFAAIVVAALAVDGIFSAANLIPTERPSIDSIASRGIAWNYTTALNIVFAIVAAALFALTLRGAAKDPVCGMNVDRRTAEQLRLDDGRVVYFCGAGCKRKFADEELHLLRRPLCERVAKIGGAEMIGQRLKPVLTDAHRRNLPPPDLPPPWNSAHVSRSSRIPWRTSHVSGMSRRLRPWGVS